jgi:hypothetical protein
MCKDMPVIPVNRVVDPKAQGVAENNVDGLGSNAKFVSTTKAKD